jgi:hypothetical protein
MLEIDQLGGRELNIFQSFLPGLSRISADIKRTRTKMTIEKKLAETVDLTVRNKTTTTTTTTLEKNELFDVVLQHEQRH